MNRRNVLKNIGNVSALAFVPLELISQPDQIKPMAKPQFIYRIDPSVFAKTLRTFGVSASEGARIANIMAKK